MAVELITKKPKAKSARSASRKTELSGESGYYFTLRNSQFIGIQVLIMVFTMGDRIFASAGNGVQTAAHGGGRRR